MKSEIGVVTGDGTVADGFDVTGDGTVADGLDM